MLCLHFQASTRSTSPHNNNTDRTTAITKHHVIHISEIYIFRLQKWSWFSQTMFPNGTLNFVSLCILPWCLLKSNGNIPFEFIWVPCVPTQKKASDTFGIWRDTLGSFTNRNSSLGPLSNLNGTRITKILLHIWLIHKLLLPSKWNLYPKIPFLPKNDV